MTELFIQHISALGHLNNKKIRFSGDLFQLNMFKKKLSVEKVLEMYNKGRCADLSAELKAEVALSWNDILTKGEKKGKVTEEENECRIPG